MVSTDKEPVEGWVDNIYGPTGAIIGVGAGLIRVLMAKPSSKVEMIPADMTVNALIATAWDVAANQSVNYNRKFLIRSLKHIVL